MNIAPILDFAICVVRNFLRRGSAISEIGPSERKQLTCTRKIIDLGNYATVGSSTRLANHEAMLIIGLNIDRALILRANPPITSPFKSQKRQKFIQS